LQQPKNIKISGFLAILLILSISQVVANLRIDLPSFSQGELDAWQQKSFVGETNYQLKDLGDQKVLEAVSEQSASILYYPLAVDLNQTPILNWSWSKQQAINPGDEKAKSGDDFVARIYVVKKGGLLFWQTRAINYVWSHQQPKGAVWNNPFAGEKAKMLAQRDAADPDQTWYTEKRNILEDFKNIHGIDIDEIDGIAVMTDSDNSGLMAKAWYGDIYFSAM